MVFFTGNHEGRLTSTGTLNWKNYGGLKLLSSCGEVNIRFGCYRLLDYLLPTHHPNFRFRFGW